MKIPRKDLRNLAVGAVVAILSVLGTMWYNEHSGRIRFLEETIEISQGIFSNIPIGGLRIVTTDKDHEIDDISLISVKLYNYSDRDFENVPVYIDLIPNSAQALEVLRADAKGAENLPVTVKGITTPSSADGRSRYGYEVRTLNRLQDREVFSAIFVVSGDVKPDVAVKIDKKGLERREFSANNIQKMSWTSTLLFFGTIMLTLVCYVVVLVWYYRRDKRREPARVKEIQNYIMSSKWFLAQQKAAASDPDSNLEPLVEYVVRETRRRSTWLNTPRPFRPTYREDE